jgi:hypothetical protein
MFYNILWIDDEHETLTGTKGRAKRNGINLIPFKSLNVVWMNWKGIILSTMAFC